MIPRLILLAIFLPSAAFAQTSVTITMTEQQADAIISAGAQCLEKAPYACAEYAIYIRNLLQAAKQPKPEAKKE